MAILTESQAELLSWVIESGPGEAVLVPVGNAPEDVLAIPNGAKQSISPSDFRELVEQGFVRHVRDKLYEVTNAGRLVYEQLKNPPPERPPVGFQPE